VFFPLKISNFVKLKLLGDPKEKEKKKKSLHHGICEGIDNLTSSPILVIGLAHCTIS
jgi:hypothetical protein